MTLALTVLFFVLQAMNSLAPGRDHAEVATAITRAVIEDRPLFANDEDRMRTASLLVAVLFRESSFDNGAIGDKGASHCAGQILLPNGARTREGWTGADLRGDIDKCLVVAMRMLHESYRVCRYRPVEERLGLYARGKCNSKEGSRISVDRTRLAKRLLPVEP